MGIFNQGEEDEDAPQSNAPDFSGREPEPVDPDSEKDTPSPVEQGAQQDTSAAYQSPYFTQSDQGPKDTSPADDYSQPAPGAQQDQTAPAGGDESASNPYSKPVTPPTYGKLQPYADRSLYQQNVQSQAAKEAGENVKPSVARKIGAILLAIAEARASGDIGKAVKVGQDFNNAPRANAEARWQQQERPLVAQGNALNSQDAATARANQGVVANNRQLEQNYRTQVVQNYDQGRVANANATAQAKRNKITQFTPDNPSDPYAGGTGVTADGRIQKGVAPPDAWVQRWIKTPQGQQATQQMTLQQRGAAADQIGLNGRDRQYFLANGKLAQPTERTTISIRENPDGSPVAPGAGRAGAGTSAQDRLIIKAKNDAMTNAQTAMANETMTAEQARKAMQDAQDNFEETIGNRTGQAQPHHVIDDKFNWSVEPVASPAASAAQAPVQQPRAAAPPQAFQYKGQTFTPGQTVMVNGKPAVVKGINPQTGKLIVGAQ